MSATPNSESTYPTTLGDDEYRDPVFDRHVAAIALAIERHLTVDSQVVRAVRRLHARLRADG